MFHTKKVASSANRKLGKLSVGGFTLLSVTERDLTHGK